jgi:cytochrome c peroxidase
VVTKTLAADAETRAGFVAAFGDDTIDSDRIARALEQFVLTLTANTSKLDAVRRGNDTLTDEEKRGMELFFTEYEPRTGQRGGDCFHCHGGALFTQHTFHNNGLDDTNDLGRFEVTHLDADRGRFVAPSLRNVARTAPYMHDGRFQTLEQVIDHYDHGVVRSDTLDPNLAKHPATGLGLTADDKRALVAFLKTLTDLSPATISTR